MLDFLGIGAQKAGTTWLYKLLSMHPSISFPAGKEIHFWDRYDQGIGRSEADLAGYKRLFHLSNTNLLRGDITPAYAIISKETISTIHEHLPQVKLIFLVRNPIDRAWSSALMALQRAQMTIEEASDQWFMDHFLSKASLARGAYANCLDNWLSCFPKEQLLIMQYEEIATNPHKIIEQTCNHLGLNPDPLLGNPILNQKVYAGTGHKLRPALHDFLLKLYKEKNQELLQKYGIDYTKETIAIKDQEPLYEV